MAAVGKIIFAFRVTAIPRIGWLDCTENGLKSMGAKRWRKTAEDICMGCRSEGGTG